MSVAIDALPRDAETPRPRLVLRREGLADGDGVASQAAALGVPPLVLRLLALRQVDAEDVQRHYLEPRLATLRPPQSMAGFEAALELLEQAFLHKWRIGVFGDYDVDGVTTATLLTTYLESLGLEVVSRVAHRESGYGIALADAEAFAQAKCRLVLMGDVGTSDLQSLTWMREHGLLTAVIDHHQVPEVVPPTDAFINPHQAACRFPFKGLCSAGVAFYLCAALRTRLAQRVTSKLPDPRGWLDLVAVATVCDMMPLREENRVLVRTGLRQLSRRTRPGFAALLEHAGVPADEVVDEEHVGFKLGPRLNAPGRLGSAEPALRLLRARTPAEAHALAAQVEALNARRRGHSDQTVAEALALLAADPRTEQRAGLVVAQPGWLPGIVGIAAARIVEHYRRPTLVLAIEPGGEVARGSVRSVAGVDVRAALEQCSALLHRFGGHREAAGVTMDPANIEPFADAFASAVAQQLAQRTEDDCEIVDGPLPFAHVSTDLCAALQHLGPFGMGFEAPRFVGEACWVERVRVLKERHLGLTLTQGGVRHEAIAFSQAFHGLREGERIACIYTPMIDRFRGRERLKLQIQRLWRE